jgi:hypothetical protein
MTHLLPSMLGPTKHGTLAKIGRPGLKLGRQLLVDVVAYDLAKFRTEV